MRYRSHQVIKKCYQLAPPRREWGVVGRYGAGEHGADTSPWAQASWWPADSAGAWAHFAYGRAPRRGQAICRAWAGRSSQLRQSRDEVKIEWQSKVEKKRSNTAINKGSSCCNKACQITVPLLQHSYFLLKTAGFQKTVFKSLAGSHNTTP